MPPLDRHRRPRPPTCWEIARRRAAQARERRRRRRGRGGALAPSSIVRDLLLRLEGTLFVSLAMTVMTAAIGAIAVLLRQPAQPASPLPSRRPAPRPASVYGLDAFADAHPGETLMEYQARHRAAAADRYRGSLRTQSVYLHRMLTGRARPSDQLAPALVEAAAELSPSARAELALLPAEVSAPASGGVFQVGSTGYTVTGTPYHPEGDAHGHVWSCPVLWGTMVTYRTATGNQAMMNPPGGADWMVAAPAAAGAASISIKGTLVSGRLLPGDMLTVNGETYTITAAVSAVSGVFNNIPLDRPLVAAVALNTPVTFSYACDRPVLAGVAGYDASQLLGGIVVGNRRVILMQERLTAAGIPTPTTADSVLIEER